MFQTVHVIYANVVNCFPKCFVCTSDMASMNLTTELSSNFPLAHYGINILIRPFLSHILCTVANVKGTFGVVNELLFVLGLKYGVLQNSVQTWIDSNLLGKWYRALKVRKSTYDADMCVCVWVLIYIYVIF